MSKDLTVYQPNAETPPASIMESPHGGVPRLNPLYEAMLIERSQYDGDIPECRTGPLPEDVLPAIPVDTSARNPVALGEMLRIASEDVKEEVMTHQRKLAAGIAEDKNVLSLVEKHGGLIAKLSGSAETDLAVYRRGEVPKPIKVATPSGVSLATMSDEERRTHAWKFLSTTQGRRTALAIVRDLVHESLTEQGVLSEKRDFEPNRGDVILAAYRWVVSLGGPNSTQPAFSFIDVAAKVLAKGLVKDLKDEPVPEGTTMYLEVISIDQLDIRTVGWSARLVSGE